MFSASPSANTYNNSTTQNEWQNPDIACVLGKVVEGAFADFFFLRGGGLYTGYPNAAKKRT